MQSPGWDPISAGSSRRSSEAGARMSPVMSHHLTKLHKKALAAGTTSSLAQVQGLPKYNLTVPLYIKKKKHKKKYCKKVNFKQA